MTAHPSAVADILVVGGGPAGASTAHHLAAAGHRVVVLERDLTPRAKACGALVTPRAVDSLRRSGIAPAAIDRFHRIDRLRFTHGDRTVSTTWPDHPNVADHALVAHRATLDQLLLDAASDAGATVLRGHEATAPIVERGFVRGAHVTDFDGTKFEARATFTVIADGANSRFGRALGTSRESTWPYAIQERAVYPSELHDLPEIELITDLRDRGGTSITGYGWMFPRGDGAVSVGVVVMSTASSFNIVNPTHVLGQMIDAHAPRWQLGPTPIEPSAGGRVPLGNSVGPAAGPTYLLIGDAGGAGNPFTGAGIESAMETGQLAGVVLCDALDRDSAATLQRYPKLIQERYGGYYKVGRLTERILGRPRVNNRFGQLLSSRRVATDAFLRIAVNELRAGRTGIAEIGYRVVRGLSLVAPES